MRYEVGSINILKDLPKFVEIENKPYIISEDSKKQLIAYSAVCPHQGGVVNDVQKNNLRCPSHEWNFNPKNGNCSNITNASLEQIKIEIDNDQIFIHLDETDDLKISISEEEKISPKITVGGSASLLIEWEGFTILTDPWIDGITMMDSWVNYPPSGILLDDLPKIDAIWISHEHSDHFHIPTLSRLDKNIPVYVPNLLEGRLEKLLRNLGFKNVVSMIPKKIYEFNSRIKAISFESDSLWADSILYLRLGNFSILNVNDAGFNWSIKNYIHDVDLLCQQFSPASSYPTCWTDLNSDEKNKLYKARNEGYLRMLKQISDTCKVKYILPFANFNVMFNESHVKYVEEVPRNRPNDVINSFRDSSTTVLDLLPGESWNGKTEEFTRTQDRENLFNKDIIFSYIKKIQNSNLDFTMPTTFDLTQDEVKEYFESFSDSKLSKNVGDYTVLLKLQYNSQKLTGFITFHNGNVQYDSEQISESPNLTMICPGNMVQKIIREDLYWDEIMYWCLFSRNPDIYNPHFEKVLHVPWKARLSKLDYQKNPEIILNTSIADIIEKGNQNTIPIFEKYGLYCTGCEFSTAETIEDGCKKHGLNDTLKQKLIKDLQNNAKNPQIELN